jgi:hypothetical protein
MTEESMIPKPELVAIRAHKDNEIKAHASEKISH